jgi:hypothetical protein
MNRSRAPTYLVLAIVGLLVGGFAGYLARPAAAVVGQLPFETVMNRGANLTGLQSLLVPTAKESFNVTVAGAAIGALVGLALAFALARR